MNSPIVLVGGGDFAKKVIKLIDKIGYYNIIGYTDKEDLGTLFSVPYLGDDNILKNVIKKFPDCSATLCIAGNMKLIHIREKIVSELKSIGFSFPDLISPNAYIDESVDMGDGCIVFDGAYIDFEVKMGCFSVINLNATICHNTSINRHVVISPAAVCGGGTHIREFSFLGLNSTVRPYVSISEKCIIGAGAVVTKDINKPGIYGGNPAKQIR